jgi:hypothetical protein
MWSGEALLHGLNPHPAQKLSPLPSKGTSNGGHHLSLDRREKSPRTVPGTATEIIGRRRLGRNGEVASKPVENLRLRRSGPLYPVGAAARTRLDLCGRRPQGLRNRQAARCQVPHRKNAVC